MFGKHLGCMPDYCTEQLERGMGRKGKRERGWGERERNPSLFPSFVLLSLSLSPPPPLFAPTTKAKRSSCGSRRLAEPCGE